ncbi:MAG: 5-oxoprolinase [Solirubrobacterales bacterium 70-9]|nr:MAG: 5-oxoprolinase [Solirubrobacterales bacterium 70-9]
MGNAKAPFRITVDTGGTFTDVVVGDADGQLLIGKAPTREQAFDGVKEALEVVAAELGTTLAEVLDQTSLFVYSTTRATNAILEGTTARTAFLTTEGFPDTLVLREGGKANPFDLRQSYPEPYVPRHLTFELPGRIGAEGDVVKPLDEARTREVLETLGRRGVEAVAVSLIWSIANGAHERRVGELIEERLPGIPFSLSHELNPIVREYRRASATAIDASLKPLMGAHLRQIESDLREAGFNGELMVATSLGGVLHLVDVAARPIETVRSGPSMAPVACKVFAEAEAESDGRDLIVCDTGGTSFDVSMVRGGAVTYSSETWLGPRFTGHLTGAPSVDIRSIGSGGGSIAWVDPGGLLRVGPQSAGADPGPACYGRGGELPTVSDAALVLGYLDPETFLGGRMNLDVEAAERALTGLAEELGLGLPETAAAVLSIANQHMVGAIQDITVNEGVDPRQTLVVAGGGAAGLGVVPIVKELGARNVLIPRAAGALSATGGQFSDVVAEFSASQPADTGHWDFEAVNGALERVRSRAREFGEQLGEKGIAETSVDYFVDARYAYQVWELEIPLAGDRFETPEDVTGVNDAFDATHHRVFAVSEPGARVECLTWKARLRAPVGREAIEATARSASSAAGGEANPRTSRSAFFDGAWHDTDIYMGGSIPTGAELTGPLIIEEATSTLVVPPGAALRVTPLGNYMVEV